MLRNMFLLFSMVSLLCTYSRAEEEYRGWRDYSGGPDASKFVSFTQINKGNVHQMQVAWAYPTGDENPYLFNPVVVDNTMYVLAKNNSLVALDASTGKEIWIHENLRGIAARGINYWESKDRQDRRLVFQMNNYLQEIDARTGKSILSFGKNGLVNLKEGLNRDPKNIARIQSGTPGRIFENLVILGSAPGEGYLSAPGDIRAYDVLTGKLAWTFHTIPHPGEFGYDTWPKDAWKYSGAANAWGELSLDDKRGIVYIPTGSATYDYYGGDRTGMNLFANCLLALDARTGKRLWHFQAVHHDLWDYDLVSAPQLITVRQNGKSIDAVAQAGKHGFLFVFDRVTGKPLWPIEERPVPKSEIPGEKTWPTQPFPTTPPPFARQKLTADDINPWYLTAEERATWKDRIASAPSTGLFTPPSTKETIAIPGARGGSNWGTSSSYPEKGLVFLLTQDWPSFYKLSLDPPAWPSSPRAGSGAMAGSRGQIVYGQACGMCHGVDRAGTATVPGLVGILGRMKLEDFRQVVIAGKGKMPSFAHLDKGAVDAVYTFLGSSDRAEGVVAPPKAAELPKGARGPVVASGGAPGGLQLPSGGGAFSQYAQYGIMGGPPYPLGVEVPDHRYYTGYGLEFGYVISPPWSSIVAYDLNKGAIKWSVPLGQDAQAASEGAKNTGTFRGGERRGIIVTATGLLFVAAPDGKVRAYNQDNGKVLWTAELPAASEGIPAMYQANGRQYLVVSSSTPFSSGRRVNSGGIPAPEATPASVSSAPKGYVAFALPQTNGK